eukprot:68182_1
MGNVFTENEAVGAIEKINEERLLDVEKHAQSDNIQPPLLSGYIMFDSYPMVVESLTEESNIGKAIISSFGSLQNFRETMDTKLCNLKANQVVLLYHDSNQNKLNLKIRVNQQESPVVDERNGVYGLFVIEDPVIHDETYRNGCKIYSDILVAWNLVDKVYQYILKYLASEQRTNDTIQNYKKTILRMNEEHIKRMVERGHYIHREMQQNHNDPMRSN